MVLIARVEAGEELVIARAGKPIVRLVRAVAEESAIVPRPGALKGQIRFARDYDEADQEIAALFGVVEQPVRSASGTVSTARKHSGREEPCQKVCGGAQMSALFLDSNVLL